MGQLAHQAKPRLLIVNPLQFGHHTEPYYYCRYLRQAYDMTYICWDYGLERIEEDGVRVLYVSRAGNRAQRMYRYIRAVVGEMNSSQYALVWVVHFRMCFVLPLLRRHQAMLLDIRSGFIGESGACFQRRMNNCFYHFESLFFENIIVLSESLRRELGIPRQKCQLVPIGAEQQCFDEKTFDVMRLLYVGTFYGRRMEDTVEGFGRFYREMRDHVSMSYDIVGYGSPEDVETIMDAIERSKCKGVVKFHGRIPYKHLGSFLERNNIGVAYIPLEDHYQCQPSTKIFEYHLAGMPVIATATNENARVINEENGVLIRDDSEAFFEGLKIMHQNLRKYNSSRIRELSVEYTWEWIINKNLAPYLAALIHAHS